jgi:hypothetical protein
MALDTSVAAKLGPLLRAQGDEIPRSIRSLRMDLSKNPDLRIERLLYPLIFYELPASYYLEDCRLRDEAGERPVAAHLLAVMPEQFEPRERAWIEAQLQIRAKLWEVIDVERGAAVHVRDDETGESHRVLAAAPSATTRVRATLLGRVITFEGATVFDGVFPVTIAPRTAAELRTLVLHAARQELAIKVALPEVRRTIDLIYCFASMVEDGEARAAEPLVLKNSDHDPVLLTKDRFSFPASRRDDVIRAVTALERCRPAELPYEPDGTVGERLRLLFWKGNDRLAIRGVVELRAQTLTLETNSVQRADALAALLARALEGIAKRGLRDHEDPARPTEGPPGPLKVPPEERAFILSTLHEEETKWLDRGNPWLGGKSPRKAIKSAKGRAAVEILLKEFEYTASAPDADGLDFDAGRLRKALGI